MSVTGNPLQPTLFERSAGPAAAPARGSPRRRADALDRLPAAARRAVPPALPELNEATLVRHYVNLSHLNWSVDTGFYPLGSCTMKYNPKVNEWAARLPGFAALHPLAPDETAQGTLELLWTLEQDLAEISGMDAVTLQPAAGAQGELTGILMVRAYHRARGDHRPDRRPRARLGPRHQPRHGVDGRLPHRQHPLGARTAASTSTRSGPPSDRRRPR